MAGNKPVVVDSIVRRTRRRVKFQAVFAGLKTVSTFLVLAAIAGFGYGMWTEVAASPEQYAKRRSDNDINYLEHWSVKAGKLIATMQGCKTEYSMPRKEIAKAEHPEPPVHVEPERPNTVEPRRDPLVPKPEPGHLDVRPQPPKPQPPKPQPPKPRPPKPRPPKPRPGSGEDARTAQLLKAARSERARALNFCEKAGPTAPSKGRIPATVEALKHLKRAQVLYQNVMKRKMKPSDRQRASTELTEIQKLMFWCHKFLPTRGHR